MTAEGFTLLIASVYRSPKKEGMYLYVEKSQGLNKVPETLLKVFGDPEHAMTLALKPERKLAQVDVGEVIKQIEEQGFFLQMPPGKEDYLLDLYDPHAEHKYRDLS